MASVLLSYGGRYCRPSKADGRENLAAHALVEPLAEHRRGDAGNVPHRMAGQQRADARLDGPAVVRVGAAPRFPEVGERANGAPGEARQRGALVIGEAEVLAIG